MRITYRIGRYSAHDDLSHVWEIVEDDEVIAGLWVSLDRGEIANIEVREDRRREGLARRLYEAASADMTVYHAPVGHRTPEGHGFAESVGGPTAEYPCDCHACDI